MNSVVRRLAFAALASTVLVSPSLLTGAVSDAQAASLCVEDLNSLLGAPALSGALGRDVHLVIWKQQGVAPTGSNRSIRVALLKIRSLLTPLHPTAMGLPSRTEPSRAFKDPSVVALVNGDLFDAFAIDASVPYAPVMAHGTIVFAPPGSAPVVSWGGGSPRVAKASLVARLRVEGVAEAPATLPLKAVNHYSLDAGPVLYTQDWVGATPAGATTITVVDGRVQRVLRPGKGLVPTARRMIIQVPGLGAAASIAAGQAAVVETRLQGVHSAHDVMGFSSQILRNGSVVSRCSANTQTLRPRTALAWDRTGRRWLVVATSGLNDPSVGMRLGGVSVPTLATWLAGIGATDAVLLDGGGSTVMLTRPLVGAHGISPVRRDLPSSAWQRPVPVVLTIGNGDVLP